MPDFIVHTYYGQKALHSLKGSCRSFVEAQLPAFVFGCQGPDFYYYQGILSPLKAHHSLRDWGNKLHNEHSAELLSYGFSYMLEHRNEKDFPILLAYWCGFICHYALDAAAHPTICSLFKDDLQHKRAELELDAYVLNKTNGKPVYRESLVAHMNMGPRIPRSIAMLHIKLIKELFGDDLAYTDINRCYQSMKAVLRLFFAPRPMKLHFIRFAAAKSRYDIGPYLYPYSAHSGTILPEVLRQLEADLARGVESASNLLGRLFNRLDSELLDPLPPSDFPSENFLGEAATL